MLSVSLKNGVQFTSLDGKSILESARHSGKTLEHSCRTGRCGVCKARLIEGEAEVVQAEESLTDKERIDGFILTCCRVAKTNIALDIEDLGVLSDIEVKTLPCRIDTIQMLSADVIEVTLRTPPTGKLEYVPGQYVDMIGRDGLRRSYSIANAPREDGKVTLQIRKVEKGKMSQFWFYEARPNDLLRMEGALGTFCLRHSDTTQLILLATGTGVAPFKAILEQLAKSPERVDFSHIYLYWGGRTEGDIYWQPDFPMLPFTFIPVLSRSAWQGRKGYIQHAVIEDGHDLTKSSIYACGSESMIQSARQQLIASGLYEGNFYSDAFVSSS